MKFLVDANVLSEPTKRLSASKVLDWLDANETELVVNPVVLGEIWRGVDALPDGQKKQSLIIWFGDLCGRMVSLDWTVDTAKAWAEMVNSIKRAGHTVGLMDTLIAATAKLHGLTVATRNVRDFKRCGVAVVNPFD